MDTIDLNQQETIVDEPKVEFRLIRDRSVFEVVNPEINQKLLEISGYDLQFNFNMEYINSIEDVEAAVEGLGDLFRQIIMDKLLEYKKQTQ